MSEQSFPFTQSRSRPLALPASLRVAAILHTVPPAQLNKVGPGHVEGNPVRHPAFLAQDLAVARVPPLLPRRGHADVGFGRFPEVQIDSQVGVGGAPCEPANVVVSWGP